MILLPSLPREEQGELADGAIAPAVVPFLML